MRKHCLFTTLLVVVLILSSIASASAPVAASNGLKVQLAMMLDGSGSISDDNWTIMVTGLHDAVQDPDCVPQDGSVELTVIQFGDYGAVLEVGPVVITSGNAASVADQIQVIPQLKGYTPIACAIRLAADVLAGSTNFHPSLKQALNLVTDGRPNVCCAGPGYTGNYCGFPDGEDSAEAARGYALTTLQMTDSSDEFDAEFVGVQGTASDWLKDEIVWPEPGYYFDPPSFPYDGPGWVRVVADAAEFAATICEKFEVIIEPGMITAHKFNDLNRNGAQDAGEDDLSGWTMTLYEGAGCTGSQLGSADTDINGNVTFSDLPPGDYSVAETLKDGWTNTTDICQNVTLSPGGSETLEFGNRGALSISGVKFNDLNGNGVNDTEPGLGDWTINLTGQMTKSTTTASDGSYSFTSLEPGTYTVSEVLKDGWTQTYPAAPGTHSVTLTNTGVTGKGFGNWQPGTITIEKQTLPEGGTGFDFTGIGFPTDCDLGAFTLDDDGQKSCDNLEPGTYVITESDVAGWDLTNIVCTGSADVQIGTDADFDPGDRSVTITLGAGESATCTFTNEVQVPVTAIISLTKTPTDGAGHEITRAYVGDTIVYVFEVENPGVPDLVDVTLTDDTVVCGTGPVRGADKVGNNDDTLEPDEIWVYTCSHLVTAGDPDPLENHATASGKPTVPATLTPAEAAATVDIVTRPPPVGGEAYPVNKLGILVPWITLAVLLAGSTSWFALRRREARS